MVARVRPVEEPSGILPRSPPHRARIRYAVRPHRSTLVAILLISRIVVVSVRSEGTLRRTAVPRPTTAAPDAPARRLFHKRVRGVVARAQRARYAAHRVQSMVRVARPIRIRLE